MGNLMGSWRYKEPSTVEECDSTWETDSESEEQQDEEDNRISDSVSPTDSRKCGENQDSSQQLADAPEPTTKVKRSLYAAMDLYKYRHSYPSYKEPRQPSEYRNLRFYLNKIPLVPDGIYVEEILTKWRGDYEQLEHNHTYIQWLFPLREQGLNFYAQELTQDEIKEFQSTREAKRRFLLAYSIMLDFFGIKLLDKTGNVARAHNWRERFQHLNESQHNYLRITRILKSLGELGFESFKPPLVQLLLEEALVGGALPNMRHSALEYFVYTLRDRSQRRALLRFARCHYRPPENFVWGPPKRRGAGAGREKGGARSRSTREGLGKAVKGSGGGGNAGGQEDPEEAAKEGRDIWAGEKPSAGAGGEETRSPKSSGAKQQRDAWGAGNTVNREEHVDHTAL